MSAPELHLEPIEVVRAGEAWRTSWRVRNRGHEAVVVETVTLPHALFRAAESALGAELPSGRDTTFALDTRVQGAPGGLVENVFVILAVHRGDERWRLLFRMRVPIGSDGTPRPSVESLTSHRIGFSEE